MSAETCSEDKFYEHLEFLKKVATNSTLTQRHAACLIKRDKIYGFGFNKCLKKTILNGNPCKITIHAEVDALFNASNKSVKGMDILVVRVGGPRGLKNSRPCNSCIDKMRRKGIRRAYYSNGEGKIVYEIIEDMPRIHITSGTMFRSMINEFRCALGKQTSCS
jgi:deoxycytidylate deaminase